MTMNNADLFPVELQAAVPPIEKFDAAMALTFPGMSVAEVNVCLMAFGLFKRLN
jgi:hypothetical protein